MVGFVVAALQRARAHSLEIEQGCEDLIASCLPDFRPRFPRQLGWRWIPPAGLEVWDVNDSPQAAWFLGRAGFVTVTLHSHSAGAPRCTCLTRWT